LQKLLTKSKENIPRANEPETEADLKPFILLRDGRQILSPQGMPVWTTNAIVRETEKQSEEEEAKKDKGAQA